MYYNHKLLYVYYCLFLILYYACCYLMTSSISTLVDLWNIKNYIIIIIIIIIIKPNIIFKTIVQKDPHRGLPTAYKHLSNNTWFILTRSPLVPTRKGPCTETSPKVNHLLQPLQRKSLDIRHRIKFPSKFQHYWFLVSKRHLRPHMHQYICYPHT